MEVLRAVQARPIQAPNQCTVACPLRTTGVFASSLTEELKESKHQESRHIKTNLKRQLNSAMKTEHPNHPESMKIRSRWISGPQKVSERCAFQRHRKIMLQRCTRLFWTQHNSELQYNVSSRVEFPNSRCLAL